MIEKNRQCTISTNLFIDRNKITVFRQTRHKIGYDLQF